MPTLRTLPPSSWQRPSLAYMRAVRTVTKERSSKFLGSTTVQFTVVILNSSLHFTRWSDQPITGFENGQFTGEVLPLTISVISHSINHLKD